MYFLFGNIIIYHDNHCEDKEVLVTIKKAIDASPELRSKKELVQIIKEEKLKELELC